MNNSEKLTEEIERVLQSGGGSALFDREIMAVLLGAVHDRKQAQDVTKTLMDNCPGIGELVAVEEVKRDAFNVARVVRNNLLNIPNRVSALLASLSDTEKIHMALTEEITNSLQELSNAKFE